MRAENERKMKVEEEERRLLSLGERARRESARQRFELALLREQHFNNTKPLHFSRASNPLRMSKAAYHKREGESVATILKQARTKEGQPPHGNGANSTTDGNVSAAGSPDLNRGATANNGNSTSPMLNSLHHFEVERKRKESNEKYQRQKLQEKERMIQQLEADLAASQAEAAREKEELEKARAVLREQLRLTEKKKSLMRNFRMKQKQISNLEHKLHDIQATKEERSCTLFLKRLAVSDKRWSEETMRLAKEYRQLKLELWSKAQHSVVADLREAFRAYREQRNWRELAQTNEKVIEASLVRDSQLGNTRFHRQSEMAKRREEQARNAAFYLSDLPHNSRKAGPPRLLRRHGDVHRHLASTPTFGRAPQSIPRLDHEAVLPPDPWAAPPRSHTAEPGGEIIGGGNGGSSSGAGGPSSYGGGVASPVGTNKKSNTNDNDNDSDEDVDSEERARREKPWNKDVSYRRRQEEEVTDRGGNQSPHNVHQHTTPNKSQLKKKNGSSKYPSSSSLTDGASTHVLHKQLHNLVVEADKIDQDLTHADKAMGKLLGFH